MTILGLAPTKASAGQHMPHKRVSTLQNGTTEEAKRIAAAALSAVKDAAAAAAASKGKVEVSTVI